VEEKRYCDVCGKETDGANMCDDCFNDAYEKERDAMTGGPDDDPRKGL
jgi:NMD protein affecting ribosome stability and mRNA decay